MHNIDLEYAPYYIPGVYIEYYIYYDTYRKYKILYILWYVSDIVWGGHGGFLQISSVAVLYIKI